MGWWVNDPSMNRSTKYPTKQRARNVSRNVKGSSVSKTPRAHHRKGELGFFGLIMIGVIFMVAAVLMYMLFI